MVPSAALQSGQQGEYVFVIKEDSTVEVRRVVAKRTIWPAAASGSRRSSVTEVPGAMSSSACFFSESTTVSTPSRTAASMKSRAR